MVWLGVDALTKVLSWVVNARGQLCKELRNDSVTRKRAKERASDLKTSKRKSSYLVGN